MLLNKLKLFIYQLQSEEESDVSVGKRIVAYIIDWYIGGVFSSIPIFVIYQFTMKQEVVLATSLFILPKPMNSLAGVLALLFAFVYYVMIPAYIWKGQTLGKKIFKIKIVNDDYTDVSLKKLILRQVVFMFLIEGRFIMPSTTLHEMISIIFNYNIVFICSYICYCITFFSALVAVRLKSHKAFHDIFAKTKVMQVNSKIIKKKRKK